jgi:hypothetical protein
MNAASNSNTIEWLRAMTEVETEGARLPQTATAVAEPQRFYVGNCMGTPIIVDRTATICGGFFGVTEVGCLSVSHRRDYTAADAQAVCDWLNASPTLQAAR